MFNNTARMPFTGESRERLAFALKWLASTEMPVEAFDSLMYEYRDNGDLMQSIHAACREWDLDFPAVSEDQI